MNTPLTDPTPTRSWPDRSFFLTNGAYLLAVWFGFYQGQTWLAWLVGAFSWLLAICYLAVLTKRGHCVNSALRGPPCPEWLTHLINVLAGAALLAAGAYGTAAGWILAAAIEQGIYWRGRRELSAFIASLPPVRDGD